MRNIVSNKALASALSASLVLVLGLYLPSFLAEWFHTAVGLLK